MPRIVIVSLLFILCLLGVRLVWTSQQLPGIQPTIEHGVLDLREVGLVDSHVRLNGEWRFSPWLFETSFPADQSTTMLQSVPGDWSASFDDVSTHYQYGTYHLRILLDDTYLSHDDSAIYLPLISQSYRLYVNGKLLKQVGIPAIDENQAVLMKQAKFVKISLDDPDTTQFDIALQVAANSNLLAGGIVDPIFFGEEQLMRKERDRSVMWQLVVCVSMGMFAAYALILFVMNINRKGMISFAFLMLCAVGIVVLDGDLLLHEWLPMPWSVSTKLLLLAHSGTYLSLLFMLRHLLPDADNERWLRHFIVTGAILAVLRQLAPFEWTIDVRWALSLSNLVFYVAMIVYIFRTMRHTHPSAFFLWLSSISIALNICWAVFSSPFSERYDSFYPFNLLIAMIGFASFWFAQFIHNAASTRALAKRLQEEDLMRDEFLAHISHELRHPLHAMINIAQAVSENPKNTLPASAKNDLARITAVGQRLSLMLSDLLDIARLQDHRLHLHLQRLHLQSIAVGVCDMLRYVHPSNEVSWKIHIDQNFPAVIADEKRLTQILFNLLHNAMKFTKRGYILIDAHLANQEAIVRISDSGSGMDRQLLANLNKRDTKRDPSAKYGGLGLGLSISRQLIELLGGNLTITSEPGVGTIVSFSLPLATDTASTDSMNTASQAPPSTVTEAMRALHPREQEGNNADDHIFSHFDQNNRPKVLAVDDDPLNLHILHAALPPDSYHLGTATSAAEALEMLTLEEWDLVIADVMMPDTSGYALTRTIRQQHSLSALPIILLTARAHPQDIATGLMCGANDYICKPVETSILAERVRAQLELRHAFSEQLQMESFWLRAQIQPHFLFNTLNSIGALSDYDPPMMHQLLDAFTRYLQSGFDLRSNDALVDLEQELRLVSSYLYIEQVRFAERLSVRWAIDEGATCQIPPFSIQTLVENALRHGILNQQRGGTVSISVHKVAQGWEITVSDDGSGIEENELRHLQSMDNRQGRGIGLRNTDRRLRQLFGRGLELSSQLGKGTRVRFIVPTK